MSEETEEDKKNRWISISKIKEKMAGDPRYIAGLPLMVTMGYLEKRTNADTKEEEYRIGPNGKATKLEWTFDD